MKFKYKDQIVTASSKVEAIKSISDSKIVLDKTIHGSIFNRAINGDKSILKLPKEDLMIQNEWGETPVHYLSRWGFKEILNLPKEVLKIQDNDGETPIYELAWKGVKEIRKLPKELLSTKNKKGRTPISILNQTLINKE